MGIEGVTESADATIVRRVLAGDTEAYAGLVARYRDRLGRYAVRMLGNRADADAARPETCGRGDPSRGRWPGPRRFRAWQSGRLRTL